MRSQACVLDDDVSDGVGEEALWMVVILASERLDGRARSEAECRALTMLISTACASRYGGPEHVNGRSR